MSLKLAKPTGLFADEYGPGAIARAAAENGYILTAQVISLAGCHSLRPESLFGRPAESAEHVAALIGADPDTVRGAYHVPRPGGLCDFFGTTVRIKDREIARRRVSPRALKIAPYIRAVWQLRPLSFDPATRESLLDACPKCGNNLGWSRAAGVCHCEKCLAANDMGYLESNVDLRDFEQPLVDVDDWEALNLVTDFVNPDPAVRDRPEPVLHDELGGLDRGQLFAFALALSCIVEQDANRAATSIARPVSSSEYAHYHSPSRLAKAGRILLNWPQSFDQLCESARADASLRGHFGVKTELGQIYALAHNASVDPNIRALSKTAIDRNMVSRSGLVRRIEHRQDDGLLTTDAAGAKYSLRPSLLRRLAESGKIDSQRVSTGKGPRLLLDAQIAELAADRLAIESVSSIGRQLGIPPAAVRDLATAGLIVAECGPVVDIKPRARVLSPRFGRQLGIEN